ncbi:unnamed protein product [Effrenium voratum]|uniref:Uncharacterized protein n=1 Tax=Effrenium voratum TaxID=2562239 RepID=A0AA36N6L8_9DINO|nr:unnamed protein product [Effrenium voratum]
MQLEFLGELGLTEYQEAIESWAAEMGAVFLEELLDNAEELAESLALKPLEKKRLQRHGHEVLARVQPERLCEPLRPSTRTAQAPSPEDLPLALFK